jgi:flagellar hook-basal body complex protein FliE
MMCSHNSSDEEQDSDVEVEELHGEQQEKQEKTSKACAKKKQKKDRQQVYEENMKAEFSQLIDPAVERVITKRDAAATAAKSATSEKVCLLESIHEYHMQ